MDESGAGLVTSEFAISEEQRGQIFDGVMRVFDAPVADGPTPEIDDALPERVPMQDLPTGVTQDIPLVHGHKFVKFDDRILIVNPTARLVVAMIPRYKLLPWRSPAALRQARHAGPCTVTTLARGIRPFKLPETAVHDAFGWAAASSARRV